MPVLSRSASVARLPRFRRPRGAGESRPAAEASLGARARRIALGICDLKSSLRRLRGGKKREKDITPKPTIGAN